MSTTDRNAERLETFTRRARDRADEVAGATGALGRLHEAGRAAFARAELPGPKTESWKYSRVGPLLEEGLLDRPNAEAAPVDFESFADLEADRILLVDGLPRELPQTPQGVTVTRLSELEANAPALAETPGRLAPADERPFVALNAALAEDGVVIHVDRNVSAPRPIELVLAQADETRPRGAHPRVLVVLEEGATATLIERQEGTGRAFTNAVIEVQLGAGARLDHLRLALGAGEARWLTALDVEVGRDARYDLHQTLVGAALRRNEIGIRLAGENGEVNVGGATLTRDRGHLDNQMALDHVVPHCRSDQVFRSIAGERSRTVLNGRIHIHPKAQKTDASLNTKNLLLSRDAEIDAKPELEIYADDVKCAHGATVGRLDPKSVFYLRARGIDETTARTMLSFAFLAEVVEDFPLESVREAVRPALERAFSAPAQEDS